MGMPPDANQANTTGPGPRVMASGYELHPGENPLDGYFANLPPDQLIAELKPRLINDWNAKQNRGLPNLWRLAYAQALGMDPTTGVNSTQQLQSVGSKAQYIRFRIQLTRAHMKQRNTLAMGQRPSFGCVAINDDAASLAQVPIAGKVMTYVFRESNGEQVCYEALDSDGYFGEGYVWTRWDPAGGDKETITADVPAKDPQTGEVIQNPMTGAPLTKQVKQTKPVGAPAYLSLYPWNVAREPNVRKSAWVITRERTSKGELIARYPEHADKIRGMTLKRETEPGLIELFTWDASSKTDDVLSVKHFYHQSDEACPGGRWLGYVEDLKLWDRPCPVATGLPIRKMCSAYYFDTPFGYPEGADLLAPQQMIDELLSQAATNILKFGNQSLWAEDGVEFDEAKLAKGGGFFTLLQNQKPPQAIQWAQLPDVTRYLLEYLQARMGEISGMNPTVMGQPQGNVDSGVFASLMQSIAEKFISSTQQAYDQLVNDVGNTTLELVRANSDSRFAAEVSGQSNVSYMKYFTADDFSGIKRVQVQRQSPVLNNLAGRFEVFDRTKDLPKDQRAASMQLLLTGDASAYMEDDVSHIILIRKEDELIQTGQRSAVYPSDDHILHVQKHKATLDRLRSADAPPQILPNGLPNPAFAKQAQVLSLLWQHIEEHAQAWMSVNPVLAAMCGIPQPPVMGVPTVQAVPRSQIQAVGAANQQTHGEQPNGRPAGNGPAGGQPQLPASQRAAQANVPQGSSGPGAPAANGAQAA